MSIVHDDLTLQALLARVTELEEAHARKLTTLEQTKTQVQEELAAARGVPSRRLQQRPSTCSHEPSTSPTPAASPTRKKRRDLLRQGLGVAAAVVGAGTLLEMNALPASAHEAHGETIPYDNVGNFSSSNRSIPAVTATGTNAAIGVTASSDTSNGVNASSGSGYGVYASSNSLNGVYASSSQVEGVYGIGSTAGVHGYCTNPHGSGVAATNTSNGWGVYASSNGGIGLYATGYNGVYGNSTNAGGSAVYAENTSNGWGVYASSNGGEGLYATGYNGVHGNSTNASGKAVYAENTSSGYGVYASSSGGNGVSAHSTSGEALFAQSNSNNAIHAVGGGSGVSAVFAEGGSGTGITATSSSGTGVSGSSSSGEGVYGTGGTNGVHGKTSNSGYSGLFGENTSSGLGIYGSSASGTAIYGISGNKDSFGVFGDNSSGGYGVYGRSSGIGVFGNSSSGYGVYGYSPFGSAGYFEGNVSVTGMLSKGGGSFKIDHPQDPAHKYLSHSFVESPDMKNIYDGVVTLDAQGEAEVQLPSWFEVLNTDFRYQLTAIGVAAPDLYIAEKISTGRFKIAGGKSGMEVSWMVTGIRQDAWANKYRIPVEEDKPAKEQGRYLHPELYGQPKEKGIGYVPLPKPPQPAQPKTKG